MSSVSWSYHVDSTGRRGTAKWVSSLYSYRDIKGKKRKSILVLPSQQKVTIFSHSPFKVQLLCCNLKSPGCKCNSFPTSTCAWLLWVAVWGCSDRWVVAGAMPLLGWLCPRDGTLLYWALWARGVRKSRLQSKSKRKPLPLPAQVIYLQLKHCCSSPLLSERVLCSAF